MLRSSTLRGCVVAVLAGLASALPADAKVMSRADISKLVRAHVAEMIAGINAHDVMKATKWEADNVMTMEAGRPPSMNLKEDREGIGMAFKASPGWRVRMIDETVDVPASREMAVYRGTYFQDSSDNGVEMTQKVNFLAGFEREKDGAWKMAWSAVIPQERQHKK